MRFEGKNRLEERLDAVAAEVEELGARPVSIEAELGEIAECDRAIKAALSVSDKLDVLV